MKITGQKDERAFTLIEVMVVISIIAVLTSLVYASFGTVKAQTRDAKRISDSVQMRTALTGYSLDHNGEVPAALPTASGCSETSADPAVYTCSTVDGVSSSLAPLVSGGYIPSIPTDPLNSGAYTYYYSTGPSDNTDPSTGALLAPSGSFDYVSEIQTASAGLPVILGINAGASNFGLYTGSGFPANIGTGSSSTVPNKPLGFTAGFTFSGSQFGLNSGNRELLAAAGGGSHSGPTSAGINLTWSAPSTGVTGYTLTKNGAFLTSVTGTSYTDTVTLPASSAYSATYTVKAQNSSGLSTPATVAVTIPPSYFVPTAVIMDEHLLIGSSSVEQMQATLSESGLAAAPDGTTYTLLYSKNSGTTKALISGTGNMTITGGGGVYNFSNTATYNLITPTTFEADLSSEPSIAGN